MTVERVEWSTFLDRFDWQQGEHVTLVGPTGCGKTTLALALLHLRDWSVVLGTKRVDSTLDGLTAKGRPDRYRRIAKWAHKNPRDRRLVLWPPMMHTSDQGKQAVEFRHAVEDVFAAGGWTLFCDEGTYLVRHMGLGRSLELLWQQGRAIGVSLVVCIQRPVWVPLEAYDAATHLFFWRDNDEANLKRIGGIGSLDSKLIRSEVARLAKHDVLYLNTRTGTMLVTRSQT